MTDDDRLAELAVRAATVAATMAEIERAEEAEGLNLAQLQVLDDRRTLAEHELAEIAAELRAIDAST
jgi:hypothetical protein